MATWLKNFLETLSTCGTVNTPTTKECMTYGAGQTNPGIGSGASGLADKQAANTSIFGTGAGTGAGTGLGSIASNWPGTSLDLGHGLGIQGSSGALMGGGSFYFSGSTSISLSGNMETTPKPDLPKLFVAGPTIGYRLWWLQEDGLLHSLHTDSVLLPGQVQAATCGRTVVMGSGHRNGAKVPDAWCSCGWYAMKDASALRRPVGQKGHMCIESEVAMWGKVIELEHGYRAEFLYPTKLKLKHDGGVPRGFPRPATVRDKLETVADTYGCVVEWGNT